MDAVSDAYMAWRKVTRKSKKGGALALGPTEEHALFGWALGGVIYISDDRLSYPDIC